jgi:hypothetical protein
MALPSSGAISMSMVKTEFSSSQTANLSLTGFGAALGTPVTSNIALAASFYGQSAVTLTSFTVQLNSEGGTFEDSESACNAEEVTQHTYYHDGSGTFPANNDHVYTNSGGTTDAPDGYIRWSPGRGFQNTSIESGVAGLIGIC